MIVTEEEAKTKRCQESFAACSLVSDQGHVFAGRDVGGGFVEYTAPVNCIGSACMAWRWERRIGVSGGYCGKAGVP